MKVTYIVHNYAGRPGESRTVTVTGERIAPTVGARCIGRGRCWGSGSGVLVSPVHLHAVPGHVRPPRLQHARA